MFLVLKENDLKRCLGLLFKEMVVIAQLVERWIVAPEVAGSTPSYHLMFTVGLFLDLMTNGHQYLTCLDNVNQVSLAELFNTSVVISNPLINPVFKSEMTLLTDT